MKKDPVRPSEKSKDLSGVRVLVGRARHQASALSSALRKLGATVIEIPFIEIRKPQSFQPLDSALRSLDQYDWLILTSVNGVEAMWERIGKLRISFPGTSRGGRANLEELNGREGHEFLRAEKAALSESASAAWVRPRIAAIGPATQKAIEQRGIKVDVVPQEYIAESVVRSLRRRVKGKSVLLVRAKVARDVIPRELRKAGARVDVVEAYETVVPESSRLRLRSTLVNSRARPHVITFTSSSTVRNFVALARANRSSLKQVQFASIGPVTSSTLRQLGLPVDIEARVFTIPGLTAAIEAAFRNHAHA
jgi:uroporphyrinogen-III synthase